MQNLCYQCCSTGQSKGHDMKFHYVTPNKGSTAAGTFVKEDGFQEYWAIVKPWGLLHRTRKCFYRTRQNPGASLLVSVLGLNCRNHVQFPSALGPLGHNLWTFYVIFAISCCLFTWSGLNASPWRNHTEKDLALLHGAQGVCEFLLSHSDLFSKVTYPKFLCGHAEARKVSGWEMSQVPLEGTGSCPLHCPVILETDNLPKEAHWTRACRQKDEGDCQDRHLEAERKQCRTEKEVELRCSFRDITEDRMDTLRGCVCDKEPDIYGPCLNSHWIEAVTGGWCVTLGTLGFLQTKPFLELESSVYCDHQHSLKLMKLECVNNKAQATANMEEGLWS